MTGLPALAPAQTLPPIELTPWRTADDVIDGWDWSLPPGVEPVPYWGVKYWDKAGRSIPGNRIVSVSTSWRELEPEEGRLDFSQKDVNVSQGIVAGEDLVQFVVKGVPTSSDSIVVLSYFGQVRLLCLGEHRLFGQMVGQLTGRWGT